MRTTCRRLRRGTDLLAALKLIAQEEGLQAAVILSGVGCVSCAQVRDADGKTIHRIDEHCEIVALQGTVSQTRCHVHIALSRLGLGVVGGHLAPGCIINTTCELVLLEQDGWRYGKEFDDETGYNEIRFEPTGETT